MPTIAAEALAAIVCDIFLACNTPPERARIAADSLTLANLKGHGSHGVIRVLEYVPWIEKGWIVPETTWQAIRAIATDSGVRTRGAA